MKDQVAKFDGRGLKCAYIGELIYMSPESLLCVLKWREMSE